MGQVAGVAMIEPVRASRAREDIAVGVEHRDRIAVLERARTPLLQGGEGGDLKLLRRSLGQLLRLAQYSHGRLCHGEDFTSYTVRAQFAGSPARQSDGTAA